MYIIKKRLSIYFLLELKFINLMIIVSYEKIAMSWMNTFYYILDQSKTLLNLSWKGPLILPLFALNFTQSLNIDKIKKNEILPIFDELI